MPVQVFDHLSLQRSRGSCVLADRQRGGHAHNILVLGKVGLRIQLVKKCT